MERSKNQRSMAVTLLIVVGITVVGVLVATGVQLLIFGKVNGAVSSAVGVVTGMVAARQFTRKPPE